MLSAFLLALASSALASPLVRRYQPVPSQDPFYVPPSGWQNAANGAVLANRTVVGAIADSAPVSPIGITTYQLLYRTTGALGEAAHTVTTVFVPSNARKDQLVHYAVAYDSADVDCSPSYSFQSNTPLNQAVAQEEPLILALLLSGYTVASADYEGSSAAYGSGRLMGAQSLDALRATINFAPIGLSSATRVAAMGYSGGATATGWAAQLQASYAPELNVVGFASGGTPADLAGALNYIDGGTWAGFVFGVFQGLIASYPSFASAWNSIATATGQQAMQDAQTMCSLLNPYKGKSIKSPIYQSAGAGLLDVPAIKSVFDSLVMGADASLTPAAPTFYYHCVADEIIPVATADAMVSDFCAHGIKSLVYQRNVGTCEHVVEIFAGFPTVLNQINAWFAGAAPQAGCLRQNVTLPLGAISLSNNPSFQAVNAQINSLLVTAINAAV